LWFTVLTDCQKWPSLLLSLSPSLSFSLFIYLSLTVMNKFLIACVVPIPTTISTAFHSFPLWDRMTGNCTRNTCSCRMEVARKGWKSHQHNEKFSTVSTTMGYKSYMIVKCCVHIDVLFPLVEFSLCFSGLFFTKI